MKVKGQDPEVGAPSPRESRLPGTVSAKAYPDTALHRESWSEALLSGSWFITKREILVSRT